MPQVRGQVEGQIPPPSIDSLLSSCSKYTRQFWGSPPSSQGCRAGLLPGLCRRVPPDPKGSHPTPAPPQSLCPCLCCIFGPGAAEPPTRGWQRAGRDGQGIFPNSSPSPPNSALASQPRGHPFGGGMEALAGRHAATPVLPVGSYDRDTPPIPQLPPPPSPMLPERGATCKPWGLLPTPTPCPYRLGRSAAMAGRWWHRGGAQGGGATPGRKRRRFVMQRNCSRRERWGDASPPRRALTPAADTPGPPQLPAPRTWQNSWAERGPRTHQHAASRARGCRSARPTGPRTPFAGSQPWRWLRVMLMAKSCSRTPRPRWRGAPRETPVASVGRAKGTWGRRCPGSSGAKHHPQMPQRRSPDRSPCACSLFGL